MIILSQLPAVLALALALHERLDARAPAQVLLAGGAAVVLGMAAIGGWLAFMLERRVAPLVRDAERLVRGEAPEPRSGIADDALGELESALCAVAEHVRERDAARRAEAQRQQTDAQIYKAVSMADSEADVVEVAGRALARVVPDNPAEILLADSRGTQLHLAAVSATGLSPGCPVESPSGCAAFRRGQTMRFARSDDLDACPRLRDRPEGICSAVCMPVNVMGRAIGVVHVTAPISEPPADEAVAALESVSTHVGARLAMLDSLEKYQTQASTDPLTGLLNRRSFEETANRLLRSSAPASVVVCDLDNFKKLNDELGHEAGDRALKVFAGAVQSRLRPGDVLGRLGGEEFGVILLGCGAGEAVAVLERCRRAVAEASASAGPRRFTASWGVAVSSREVQTLHDLLRTADKAMYEAKHAGRDRIVVAGEHPTSGAPAPDPVITRASSRPSARPSRPAPATSKFDLPS